MKLSKPHSYSTWSVASEIVPDDLTKEQWQWLTNTNSLTQSFRQLTNNQIEHLLELEQTSFAYPEEQTILKLVAHNSIWQRQIQWKYQEKVWVCGRVVIPNHTISSVTNELKQLGKRSLGDFLFSHPSLNRQPIEICRIGYNHPYYHHAKQCHQQTTPYFWSRRSIFTIDQQALLVAETFLPAFFNFIQSKNHDTD